MINFKKFITWGIDGKSVAVSGVNDAKSSLSKLINFTFKLNTNAYKSFDNPFTKDIFLLDNLDF